MIRENPHKMPAPAHVIWMQVLSDITKDNCEKYSRRTLGQHQEIRGVHFLAMTFFMPHTATSQKYGPTL